MASQVRIEPVPDLHRTSESVDPLGDWAGTIAARADPLHLAGDFTQTGNPAELAPLLDQLTQLRGFPVVAVLGNHDRHCGEDSAIARALEGAGAVVLDGASARYVVGEVSIGIAAVPGGRGGFGLSATHAAGDPEVRALRHPPDLVIHGHAHTGTQLGATVAGVPVRNVARPVLQRSSTTYEAAV